MTGVTAMASALKARHPEHHVVVVWDRGPCHRSQILREIPGLTVVPLPSYSPQLNPPERFFEEVRRDTCNTIFSTLEKLEEVISASVKRLSDDVEGMKRLLGYEWIRQQCSEVN